MKTYKITITGWELIASGHSLKDEEVENIREHQEEKNIKSLEEMSYDLEVLVEGYYPGDGNMWSFSRPLENDALHFHITDLDDTEIINFSGDELGDHEDYEEDYDITLYNGYPSEEKEKNILLYLEENKGTICSYEFESEETPTPKDFTFVRGSVETPDGDWDVVDKLFFKGKELEPNWDSEYVRGKNLTIQLWTMDDVN